MKLSKTIATLAAVAALKTACTSPTAPEPQQPATNNPIIIPTTQRDSTQATFDMYDTWINTGTSIWIWTLPLDHQTLEERVDIGWCPIYTEDGRLSDNPDQPSHSFVLLPSGERWHSRVRTKTDLCTQSNASRISNAYIFTDASYGCLGITTGIAQNPREIPTI